MAIVPPWTLGSITKVFEIRGDYRQVKCALATNAVVKRGDLLVMTSGAVDQAISLPGTNDTASSAASTVPYGVALEDKDQTAGDTHVQVAVFRAGQPQLAMRIYNGTAGDAEAQDLTLLTSYQYHRYRGASATQWWYMLATTTSSTPPFEFVEAHPGNNAGDDYGVVWVSPLNTLTQEGN